MKPRIGITVHMAEHLEGRNQAEVRFSLTARYAEAVLEAGGLPLLLPTHPDSAAPPAEVVSIVDGLLLSGGGSLPRQYFADNPNPSLRQTNPLRFDVEVALVRAARAERLPILGICRGHQTMLEALGGAPVRNLDAQAGDADHYQSQPSDVTTHGLRTVPGSRLAGWLGEETRVNSFHRQVVQEVPPGWRVAAWSDDGLVEAIEASEGFAIGLQFHPEWLEQREPAFRRIFEAFVAAAAARS